MLVQSKSFLQLVWISAILFCVPNCMNNNSQDNKFVQTNHTNPLAINIEEFDSSIDTRIATSWKVKTVQLARNEDINKVFFYDKNIGYLITASNSVFKSDDGGNRWRRISSFKRLLLRDIFFSTVTEGFVVASSPSHQRLEARIMRTANGGSTWEVVHSSTAVLLKVIFNSSGGGIAVGQRENTASGLESLNAVFISSDQGHEWIDVSNNLNELALKENGRVEDSITDVSYSGKTFVLLSLRGKIYQTDDSGQSWSIVGNLTKEPHQTNINRFGRFKDGRFWLAGGAISDEGNWGVIAVMSSISNWTRLRLADYSFDDVSFLSNNEVLACGSSVASTNSGDQNELNKGVVLYSSDRGMNWETLYESKSSTEFSSISRLSDERFIVAGTKGQIIVLDHTSSPLSK